MCLLGSYLLVISDRCLRVLFSNMMVEQGLPLSVETLGLVDVKERSVSHACPVPTLPIPIPSHSQTQGAGPPQPHTVSPVSPAGQPASSPSTGVKRVTPVTGGAGVTGRASYREIITMCSTSTTWRTMGTPTSPPGTLRWRWWSNIEAIFLGRSRKVHLLANSWPTGTRRPGRAPYSPGKC